MIEQVLVEFSITYTDGLECFYSDGWEFRINCAGLKGFLMERGNRRDKKQIFIDAAAVYDKCSKSPIQLPIPINQHQRDFLIEKMKWLQTPEGLEFASGYNFIEEYPKVTK